MRAAALFCLALALPGASMANPAASAAPHSYKDGISGPEMADLVETAMLTQGVSGLPNISLNRGYPGCSTIPSVGAFNGDWSIIRVSCDGSRKWHRHLRNSVQATYVPRSTPQSPQLERPLVATLTRSLKRGALVTAEDVELAPAGTAVLLGGFTDLTHVIGRRVTTNVNKGRPVQARQLEQNWVITRDMPVEIRYASSTFSISTPGIALKNGQMGEFIDIRNLSSGAILKARVTGPQKVQIIAKTR